MRLVRIEEEVTSLYEPPMISNSIDLFRKVIVLVKLLELIIGDVIVIEKVTLIDLNTKAFLFIGPLACLCAFISWSPLWILSLLKLTIL